MAAQGETLPNMLAQAVGLVRPEGCEGMTAFEACAVKGMDEIWSVMEQAFPRMGNGGTRAGVTDIGDPHEFHQGFVLIHEAVGKACNAMASALPERDAATSSSEAAPGEQRKRDEDDASEPPKKRVRFDNPESEVFTLGVPSLEEGRELRDTIRAAQARGTAFIRRYVAARSPCLMLERNGNPWKTLAEFLLENDSENSPDARVSVADVVSLMVGNLVHIEVIDGTYLEKEMGSYLLRGPRKDAEEELAENEVLADLTERYGALDWAEFARGEYENV